ncbi:uncharacterized protein DUF2631 [Tamaricihabitans halophyticus]|uniref:Uncharacterized protein DUF2631 n=1 Tax=Tamaricihabitans halophyticus TaxID=1262583 RepID=A0A4R2QQC9_9PSEU|nr:DUF2631 domain-containing protein [Tamaricihabitans halophyticus]TCP51942.1 uncharacterized protein DUF2631 [Tamaricihabitans halophyticus]
MADTKSDQAVKDVDTHDEPSVEWGWHGHFPKATLVAGTICTAIMLLLLIGNHESNTENIWLISLAVGMAGGLVFLQRRRRTPWRR